MNHKLRYEYEPIAFKHKLESVGDVAVDSLGHIHAAVNGEIPIEVFNQQGKFLYAWGKGDVVEAHGLYIDRNDCCYVADSKLHTVMKFSPEHRLMLELGNRGKPSDTGVINGNFKTIRHGGAPFNVPSKVTASPNGEIFVCDGYGNARGHRFSADGVLLKSWGEPGSGAGEFHIPHGVGVDEQGRVYVADRENDRVQVFDTEGKLLSIWNDISRPDGLCVRDGKVYVAELGHLMYVDNVLYTPKEDDQWSRMRVFDTEGHELARFGTAEGWREGNLFAAHGVNLDRHGNLYIAETGWPDSERSRPEALHGALQ